MQIIRPHDQKIPPHNKAITEMAERFKIRIIPLRGKIPLIKDWPQKASYDPIQLNKWESQFPGCDWGMTLDDFFVVDIDGELGAIKKEWLNSNPYRQKTTKGHHYLYKNTEGIKGKIRLTGSVDILARGKQIKLYKNIFSYLLPPSLIPEPPKELLDFILKREGKKTEWTPGQRNNTLNKKIYLAVKNESRAGVEWAKEKALKAGLPKEEVERTAKSAIDSLGDYQLRNKHLNKHKKTLILYSQWSKKH